MHLARARSLALAPVLLLVLSASACGGSASTPPPKSAAPAPVPSAAPTTTAAVTEKATTLKRSQVRTAIKLGLGVFFQHVALEDWPVMKDGKFHGFKIRGIDRDWLVDLRAGDVVVGINGMPIEHPEEADAALRSLEKAKTVRVDFERDGKSSVYELPIVED